jgi:hypothetical protein
MPRYKIVTLVDITRTDAKKSDNDQHRLAQQANFNSLLQAIGLRSNVSWNYNPRKETGRLPEPVDGKANHWIWEFDVEREEVFLYQGNPVGLLIDDLHCVPIISDLENSVDLTPPAFQTKGKNINTWLTIIQ